MKSLAFTSSWGEVAAMCELSGHRVDRWLNQGRPYSLSALDALQKLANQRLPLTRARNAKLIGAPRLDVLKERLHRYSLIDPVPRVTKKVESILSSSNLHLLTV